MKKRFVLSLVCAGMAFNMVNVNAESKEIHIVCAAFPEYDWVKEILGDHADQFEVTLLLDNGADVHSFQPSAEDIAVMSSCDMMIYGGGASESWIDAVLKEAVNENMVQINLMEVLGDATKEEEIVEGMQEEEHEQEEEPEYDEHIWLSLKNAQAIVYHLTDAVASLDPENTVAYEENGDKYIKKLASLDEKYQEMVETAKRKTVLFADRFPFRYLMDDYGIEYFAAFAGCSAETEASFETVTFLSGKMDELNLPVLLTIENSDQKIAEVVRKNTKSKEQEIRILNSLQSVTDEEIQSGITYLTVMEENYSVLEQALN